MGSYWSLDLRSLAVWRMALGALVLWDIVLRLRDLQAFYGDEGVFSRELCFRQNWGGDIFHLFFATGSTPGLLFLFGVWAVAATCLTVGYRTRLAGFITWYFTVSIQLRNPMVLDGGDEILRVLLFWTPFLPLAARWSVEAASNESWKRLPNTYRSVATCGVYLQFFLFYFFAAFLKSGEDWLKTQDAVYYALSIDQFTTGLGRYLSQFPDQLRPLTWGALGTEYLLALLLLVPLRVPYARTVFLFLAVGFHLAIAALFHFGIFMLIMLGLLLVFIPPRWWDRFPLAPSGTDVPDGAPAAYRLARPTQIFCLFICAYLIFVNIHSVKHVHKLTPWAHLVARYTYQHQHWHLFAPQPFREDGFFVLEITTARGMKTDALSLSPLGDDGRPVLGSARFPNQRWRRWLQNLVQIDIPDNQAWRMSTLTYLVEEWSRTHPEERWMSARLIFMREPTPPPGEKPSITPVILADLKKVAR
jgi:hypothetical protein